MFLNTSTSTLTKKRDKTRRTKIFFHKADSKGSIHVISAAGYKKREYGEGQEKAIGNVFIVVTSDSTIQLMNIGQALQNTAPLAYLSEYPLCLQQAVKGGYYKVIFQNLLWEQQ